MTSSRRNVKADAMPKGPSARRVGGVAAMKGPCAPRDRVTGLVLPKFTYHGGPVIKCPLIYATYWGESWTQTIAGLADSILLGEFLTDLVNSEFMNVLSQYGVGSGAGSGMFMQRSYISNVPPELTDSDIHSVLQNAINSGAIPEPPSNNTQNVVIIFLDSSTTIKDAIVTIAFGHHGSFTTAAGNPCYYSVIPALDDTCLKNSCPMGDEGCSLHLSQTQQDRRTQVASHEFAEVVTDPMFLTGWADQSQVMSEIGDICHGEADTITVESRSWNVQRIYSKATDIQSNGASFCIAGAPTPIPKLSPGPSMRRGAIATAQRFAAVRQFLPLPAVHHDAKALATTWEDKDVDRYIRQLFHPLHHSNVVADLPKLLSHVANVIRG